MRTLRTFLGHRLDLGPTVVALSLAALSLAATYLPRPAHAADPEPLSAEDRADAVGLTDGKGHYLVVLPLRLEKRRAVFYSPDGKTAYQLDLTSQGGEVGKFFSYLFVDPRHYKVGVYGSSVEFSQGAYSVTCGERKVPLQVVSAPDTKAQLLGLTPLPSPRKWRPHSLSRDDRGTYYYVDRGRTKATEKQYRLFAGPSGGLKPLKMTNIIADSEGEIFSTKTGSLRLIVGKKEYVWIAHEKQNKLTTVPVEDNLAMIYNDLGVYTGEKMGTPCDDM
jgi:hypothetical protein